MRKIAAAKAEIESSHGNSSAEAAESVLAAKQIHSQQLHKIAHSATLMKSDLLVSFP